jgi:chemosensory pili system protein ChpE
MLATSGAAQQRTIVSNQTASAIQLTIKRSTTKGVAEMVAALGIMLGLAYVVAPGPVNIETLRRGLTGGIRVALALQLGSIIGDLFWALLAMAGTGLLLSHTGVQMALGITGTALLVYLGWSALRSWPTISAVACPVGRAATHAPLIAPTTRRTLWTGIALATANPFGPAFWVSLNGVLGHSPQHHTAAFFGGFFLGSLLASLGIALLAGTWRRWITPRLVQFASCGCGLALIACGALVGYTTIYG